MAGAANPAVEVYKQLAMYARSRLQIFQVPRQPELNERLADDVVDGFQILPRFLDLPVAEPQLGGIGARFRETFLGYVSSPRSHEWGLSDHAQNLAALLEPFAKKLARFRFPNTDAWKLGWDDVVPLLLDVDERERAGLVRAAKKRAASPVRDVGAALFAYVYPWRHRRAHEAHLVDEVAAIELANASLALLLVLTQRQTNFQAVAAALRVDDASETDAARALTSLRLRREAFAYALRTNPNEQIAELAGAAFGELFTRQEPTSDVSLIPSASVGKLSAKQRGFILRTAAAERSGLDGVLEAIGAVAQESRRNDDTPQLVVCSVAGDEQVQVALLTAVSRGDERPATAATLRLRGDMVIPSQTVRIAGRSAEDLLLRLVALPHTEIGVLLDGDALKEGRLEVLREFLGDRSVLASGDGEIWVSHCCYDSRQHSLTEHWVCERGEWGVRSRHVGYRWGPPEVLEAADPAEAVAAWITATLLHLDAERAALATAAFNESHRHLQPPEGEFANAGPVELWTQAVQSNDTEAVVDVVPPEDGTFSALEPFRGQYRLVAEASAWKIAAFTSAATT